MAVKKQKELCHTRWFKRIDVLHRFKNLLPCLVNCFRTISDEGSSRWSQDSLTDANELLLAISTTEFLRALIITSSCLSYLLALTKSLQSEAKDIVQSKLVSVLKDVSKNVDVHHNKWFVVVEQLSSNNGIELSLLSLCGRQTHRSNITSQTSKEYYRQTITIPLLNHIISEMIHRFVATNTQLL